MTSLGEHSDIAQQTRRDVDTRTMTVGDFLLRRLHEAGIRHMFGVPGDFNLELLQQMEDGGYLK
jgi:indolepyruvate decarboxylase